MKDQKRHRYKWSLKAMRTFEVCARRGSFSAAAGELRITQGAVSKQIKGLEENLGLALFHRQGNRIDLSVEGTELAEHLFEMFEGLDRLVHRLGPDHATTPLIVSCEPTICLKLLIPLAPVIEEETGIQLKILSGGGAVDFHGHGIDLAIRRNDFDLEPDRHIETIAKEYVGPVMNMDLSFGKGSEPQNHTRIRSASRPDAWLRWNDQTRKDTLTREIEHQHHFLALEAAENGHGIAMMSLYMVARNMENTRLTAPFGFIPDGSKYICISTRPIDNDPRKRAVVDWLTKKFHDYKSYFATGAAGLQEQRSSRA
jgi:DNA-binding transcriptional LysR family regulator